jgi:hypothetical protein
LIDRSEIGMTDERMTLVRFFSCTTRAEPWNDEMPTKRLSSALRAQIRGNPRNPRSKRFQL